MKFNSQICTSRSQSERLLALGLKKESADMIMLKELTYDEKRHCLCDADTYMIRPIDYLNGEEHRGNIPAWSLHRLIEMMPQEIFYEDSTLILGVFGDGVYYADNEYGEVFNSFDGNLYDCVVKCIEWLIKEGYFNKEYLEE